MEYREPPAARGLQRPSPSEIAAALAACAPELAGEEAELIAEGWVSWAFRAGDWVLRFPKLPDVTETFAKERWITPALAPALPVPIAVTDLFCADGPNGLPFIGHRHLPGVTLGQLHRPVSPRFAAELGRFIRALHAFPVERALDLGLALEDGPASYRAHEEEYERLVRNVFPLLGCETRRYCQLRYERFLGDPANFAFAPRVVHADLDQRNTLVDPGTGDLAGVLDFGDVRVGDPALDFCFWLTLGFRELGIEDQVEALLRAYDPALRREDLQSRCDFYAFKWPLGDIEHGLMIKDEDFVAQGIRSLNALVPRDLRC